MAGMELRTDFFNFQNPDLLRQQRIDSTQGGVRVHGPLRVDIGHLAVRMHPRIGTAGANNVDGMVEKPAGRTFQFALDGLNLRLNLPSMETSTVISQRQLEVPHAIRL